MTARSTTTEGRQAMKPAVITGAASGIGQALARAIAAQGRSVFLADIAATDAVAAEIGGTAITTDVAEPAQMEHLARIAADARLVCLNAGITGVAMGPPWEASDDEWEKLLRVNLLGVVNGLRSFVPRLLAADEPGRILITASLAGLVTFPSGGAYAATKHALVAVAEQTALALADTNVGVTVACPALVRTGMSPHGVDPADVAVEALQACDRGQFVVAPSDWTTAITDRGRRLATGEQPQLPTPT